MSRLFVPRDYQIIARDFIIDTPRANLWADMGLGKSITQLTTVDLLALCGSTLAPHLVLAPLRVAEDVWPDEGQKWEHTSGMVIQPITGPLKRRKQALKQKADLFTINYENIPWLVEELNKKWPFKGVTADESTKLKGFRLRKGGKRAAAMSKIARQTVRWLNMTGTPAPNGLLDLWGQQYFVDFGQRLGRTFTAYKQRWFDDNQYAHTIEPYPHSQAEIINAISDVTISLEAKDWFPCDEPVMRPVYVDLTGQTRKLYSQMEAEYYAELDSGASVEAVNAMAKLGKLMQITSGAIYTDKKCTTWERIHDAKLDALARILDELDGQPLLIAYYWRHSAERILARFPKLRAYKNKQDERDWNAGKLPGMLAHPASAGHGMNWQDGGCNMCYFDQTWNSEHRRQILERIGPVRQLQAGHPRPVNVWDIIARNTKDEDCKARVEGKVTLEQALRGATRARLAA